MTGFTLNGDEDLKEGGSSRLPARPLPGAQQAETDLAAVVEVGVDPLSETDSCVVGRSRGDLIDEILEY